METMFDHNINNETNFQKEMTSNSNESQNIRKKIRKSSGKDLKVDYFDFPVFSVRYKDPSIELSEDRLTAVGYKGWSTVLLTHGANSGIWYFEITVLEPQIISKYLGHSKFLDLKQEPSIRVGWSCRYNRLDVPVGTSSFGYSFSTKNYSLFTNSRAQMYSENEIVTQIKPGDIIGCLIKLSGIPYELEDPRNCPHLHPYLELGLLCNPEVLPKVVNDPSKFFFSFSFYFKAISLLFILISLFFLLLLLLKDSIIEFYVNGKKINSSFSNIASGFYHPTVSLYMGSSVKINTGPNFTFSPQTEFKPAEKLLRPEII